MQKKYIGIIRRNGLGDVLCALPLIAYCKEKNPEAQIVLFIDERAADLAPYLVGPDIVEIIPHHANKYVSILKAAIKGRKYNFEWIISAKPMPMKLINWFLFLLRGKRKSAYVDSGLRETQRRKDAGPQRSDKKKIMNFLSLRFSSAFLLNDPIPFKPFVSTHQALRSLLLIDPTLQEIPERFFPRLKQIIPITPPHPILLISVTNNRIGSLLDNVKYVRLLNQLSEKKRFSVVINCEPKDLQKAEALKKSLSLPAEVRPTSQFADFLQLIAESTALFIGDGGIMHLAAALDKPQVILFGGTDPLEWAPLSKKARSLSHPENVNFIAEETILTALESIL